METKILPKIINASKVITYEVDSIIEMIVGENDVRPDEVTLEMIMDKIEEWASTDITEGRDDLIIYQDENGKDIEL
jgi:hypothetical protein